MSHLNLFVKSQLMFFKVLYKFPSLMFHSLLLVTKFTYPVLCFFTLNKALLSPVWPKRSLGILFSVSSSCPSHHTYFSLNSVIASCSFFLPLLLPHLSFYLCLIVIFISVLLKGTVMSIWFILVASVAHVSVVTCSSSDMSWYPCIYYA